MFSRVPKLVAAAAALVALALALPAFASAATFTVTTTTDGTDPTPGNGVCGTPCTLRAAVQEANGFSGSDTIVVPSGKYTLALTGANEDLAATGDLDITSPITIRGAGSGSTIVDGNNTDRVFDVLGGSATLSGMTIQHGSAGTSSGGGIQTATSTTLSNVVVNANTASGGGGIYNTNLLTVGDSTISSNNGTAAGTGTADGGGIQNTKRADLTRVTVSGNTVDGNGGGIATSGFAPDGLRATDVTVTGNTAGAGGGIAASANAILNRVVVSSNTATTGAGFSGGGVSSSALAPDVFSATDTQITGNHMPSNGQGAGFVNSGDSVTLTRVKIDSNSAQAGAGGGQGGGLYNSGTVTAFDSSMSGNTLGAASDGGGVWNSGALTLNRVTAASNNVGGDGGGIYSSAATTLTNVTLSGNQAGGAGGGMRTDDAAHMFNVTVAGNTAPGTSTGGVLATDIFPSDATNSIVSANSGGDCGDSFAGSGPPFTSNGGNYTGASCAFAAAGDITGSSPRLASLASNGGSVKTRALLSTSPAIDAGRDTACASFDARRVTRPQLAHCDIGAYEYSPPSASLAPPACSQSGAMSADVTPASGGASPTGLFVSVDGGAAQRTAVSGGTATVSIPEGSHSLEYWGESAGGDVELVHHFASALVDGTAPSVSITSDQGKTSYFVGEAGSVTTTASDAGSGLATDPSAAATPLDTSFARTINLTATAVDRCSNQATAAFSALVGPRALARPVAGATVNVQPVSGTVLVEEPGSKRFSPLTKPSQIRNGSIIDARHGRVRITIDNGRGGLDTADFYQGIFKFIQPKVKPGQTAFANLYLFAGKFTGCPVAPRKPKIAGLAKSKHRSVRHLWGSGKGAFRTVGRFSSASVRGTTWLTDDRCDGTLTKVTTGKIAVRDFVKRKTVIVRKGKTYFAAARRR